MAATNPTKRRQTGVRFRYLVRRYRFGIAGGVEIIALVLRLPLVVHLVLLIATELAIALLTSRERTSG